MVLGCIRAPEIATFPSLVLGPSRDQSFDAVGGRCVWSRQIALMARYIPVMPGPIMSGCCVQWDEIQTESCGLINVVTAPFGGPWFSQPHAGL